MKTHGQQALSWYWNNFLLANPDRFQSLNIYPWKLDKSKSNKTLRINDLDIANPEKIKLLGVHIAENINFTEHISKLPESWSTLMSSKPDTLQGKATCTTVQIFYTALFNLLSSALAFLQLNGQKKVRTNTRRSRKGDI